jgi:predicted RNA-binding protein
MGSNQTRIEVNMCLSTVYLDKEGSRQKVMQDVASMRALKNGFEVIDLLGVRTFVHGRIKSLDFVDDPMVLLEDRE